MYKFMHTNNGMIHKKFKKIKTQFNSYEIIPHEWQVKKIDDIFKFFMDHTIICMHKFIHILYLYKL